MPRAVRPAALLNPRQEGLRMRPGRGLRQCHQPVRWPHALAIDPEECRGGSCGVWHLDHRLDHRVRDMFRPVVGEWRGLVLVARAALAEGPYVGNDRHSVVRRADRLPDHRLDPRPIGLDRSIRDGLVVATGGVGLGEGAVRQAAAAAFQRAVLVDEDLGLVKCRPLHVRSDCAVRLRRHAALALPGRACNAGGHGVQGREEPRRGLLHGALLRRERTQRRAGRRMVI